MERKAEDDDVPICLGVGFQLRRTTEQLKELISAADFTLPKQAVRRLRDLEDMKL